MLDVETLLPLDNEYDDGTTTAKWAAMGRSSYSRSSSSSDSDVANAAFAFPAPSAPSAPGEPQGEAAGKQTAAAAESSGPRILKTLTVIVNNCNGPYPVRGASLHLDQEQSLDD